MEVSHGGAGGLPPSVKLAFDMFSRARKAISRVFVPTLDLYADGAITLEDVLVATGATSPAKQVQFIADGYLVAITASVQSGTAADLATTKLAVKINGSTDIFVTGQSGEGFVSFAQLQFASGAGQGLRIMAPIRERIPYAAFIKYEGASGTVTADVTFWYVNTSNPPLTD